MADILNSNVNINTELKVVSNGFKTIMNSAKQLDTMLRKLETKPYQIKIVVSPTAIASVNALNTAMGALATNAERAARAMKAMGLARGAAAAGTWTQRPTVGGMPGGTTGAALVPVVPPSSGGKLGERHRLVENYPDEITTGTPESRASTTKVDIGHERTTITRRQRYDKEQKRLVSAGTTVSTTNLRQQAAERLADRQRLGEATRLAERDQLMAQQRKWQPQYERLRSQGFTEAVKHRETNRFGVNMKGAVHTFTKELSDGRTRIMEYNELSGKIERSWGKSAEYSKRIKQQQADMKKMADTSIRTANIKASAGQFEQMVAQGGYKPGLDKQVYDAQKKQWHSEREATRVRRTGFAKYEVDVLRYNEQTGDMIRNTLHGAQAAKFLGDSLFRAGEKVLIWTMSTTILFGAMRVIKSLTSQIIELESNSILLARVSDRIVSGFSDSNEAFKVKLGIANRLTDKIMQLTSAIGGNAAEAQKAAATFLRAGQQEHQVITSVTAALLASRIAEMGVAEAATFLSSSQQQFNMDASESILILDSLNTLSNNYKVSTMDLFDAISRAGSVFADHNGRLEELAALTAIVSERTARTGTQIGNAFKTIQSRMDRSEIRNNLFEKLQISSVDLRGESKSLSKMLLEVDMRLKTLTASEQKQQTVNIAGVRQRNILVAALKDIDKALIAYNKSLMESGSAQEEYLQDSKTIRASLDRIKGSFAELANDSRGSLGVMMHDMANAIERILQLMKLFGSAPAQMAIYAATIYLTRKALMFLVPTLFYVNAAGTKQALTWNQATFAAQYYGRELKLLAAGLLTAEGRTRALTAAQKGLKLAWASTKAFIFSPGFVAMAGIGLVTHFLIKATESTLAYSDATGASIAATEKAAAVEGRRVEALKQTIGVISAYRSEIQKLDNDLARKNTKTTKSQVEARKAEINTRAASLLKSFGINVGSDFDVAGQNVIQDIMTSNVAEGITSGMSRAIASHKALMDSEKKLAEAEQASALKSITNLRVPLAMADPSTPLPGVEMPLMAPVGNLDEARGRLTALRLKMETLERDKPWSSQGFSMFQNLQKTSDVQLYNMYSAMAKGLEEAISKHDEASSKIESTNESIEKMKKSLGGFYHLAGDDEAIQGLIAIQEKLRNINLETADSFREIGYARDAIKSIGMDRTESQVRQELAIVRSKLDQSILMMKARRTYIPIEKEPRLSPGKAAMLQEYDDIVIREKLFQSEIARLQRVNLGHEKAIAGERPFEDLQNLKKELPAITAARIAAEKKVLDATAEIPEGKEYYEPEPSEIKASEETTKKLQSEARKLENELRSMESKARQEHYAYSGRTSGNLAMVMARNTSAIKNQIKEVDSAITEIESKQLRRNVLDDRTKSMMKEFRETKLSKDDPNYAVKLDQLLANRLIIQQDLTELKETERDIGISMLETEGKLLEKRREATKEAFRAMGVLSETDKMRALTWASWAKANPNAKISSAAQFYMMSENLQIARQFLAGRMANPLEERGAFKNMFPIDWGQGATQGPSEDFINNWRAGRTDDKLLEDLNKLVASLSISEGVSKGSLSLADSRFSSEELDRLMSLTRPEINYNLTIPPDSFSLEPMANAFDRAIREIIPPAVDNFLSRIEMVTHKTYKFINDEQAVSQE